MDILKSFFPIACSCTCVVLSLMAIQPTESALTFELPDNDVMCFFEEFTGTKKYKLDYHVIKGGQNDVDVNVLSPNGLFLYKEKKRRKGTFEFDTSEGKFSFCFSNEFSTISHKTIYFSVVPTVTNTLAEDMGNDSPTANTQLEEAMENVYAVTKQVHDYQTEYRLNEARGRNMADSLNMRVHYWSIFEAIIIVATGFGQIMILRTFFTDKLNANKPEDA